MKRAGRIAELGLMTALAVILGWVELMLPLLPSVPGIKLGLGNIVIVLALYRSGAKEAAMLSAAKVLLSALIFGSFSGLVYSASGALCSFIVMRIMYKQRVFSEIGVSAAGGAAHIAAQLCVAIMMTSTPQLWRFGALLLFAGTLTGVLNGALIGLIRKKLPDYQQME